MIRTLAAGALLALAPAAQAQTFGRLQQDARTGISDVQALGRGGAVAAAPTLDSPFFSNPAHLGRTTRASVTILGATGGVGGNVFESYDFYDQTLGPAIEEGLDGIRDSDEARLEAIYDEAIRVGRIQKTADVAVLAPSVRARVTPSVVVGAGLYTTGTARARISDGGAGIPFLDAYSQADVLVPLGASVDVPRLPFRLSLGATATYVQRRIAAKAGAVDAFDPDNEKLYIFRGDGVRLAVGADARDVGTRGLDVGLALTDIGSALGVAYDDAITIDGPTGAPDDAAEIAGLEARFNVRSAGTAVRAGAAYRVALPASVAASVSNLAVMADYTSASTSEFEQSMQAGLRGGVAATLGTWLDVRAGLSQGMPTAGVGLVSRYARIDYATYGVEDGRLLGQQGRRNHVVQIRFGLF